MSMLRDMLANQAKAKRFAGRVVAAMIRRGCDPETMRRYEIPKSVFYGVLGGMKHLVPDLTPDQVAVEEIRVFRDDYLFAHNKSVVCDRATGAQDKDIFCLCNMCGEPDEQCIC